MVRSIFQIQPKLEWIFGVCNMRETLTKEVIRSYMQRMATRSDKFRNNVIANEC